MVFGATAQRNKTHNPGGNFVEREEFHQGSGGSEASVSVVDSSVATASTVNFNGTFSSNVDWAVVAVELKPQAGALTKQSGVAGDSYDLTEAPLPMDFELVQNFPNPFNPTTTIKFALPEASQVTLRIINIRGKLVRTLASGGFEAGYHQFLWDATNDFGVKVSSGMYFYQLQSNDFHEVRKMLLLK